MPPLAAMRHILTFCLFALPATAQTLALTQTLTQPDDLAYLAALPRLTAQTPAAQKINAALAALDRAAFEDAQSCVIAPPDADPPDQTSAYDLAHTGFYDRAVAVTMAGPLYLSLLVTVEADCPGAAHGFQQVTVLVYDLQSGAPVPQADLTPKALLPLPPSDPYDPAAEIARSKAATDLYLRHAALPGRPECRAALQDLPHGFLYWPDAARHALILQPAGLPHVLLPCATPAAIPAEDLAALGAPPGLTQALAPP